MRSHTAFQPVFRKWFTWRGESIASLWQENVQLQAPKTGAGAPPTGQPCALLCALVPKGSLVLRDGMIGGCRSPQLLLLGVLYRCILYLWNCSLAIPAVGKGQAQTSAPWKPSWHQKWGDGDRFLGPDVVQCSPYHAVCPIVTTAVEQKPMGCHDDLLASFLGLGWGHHA